jgi:hypothetical protein
VNVGVGSHPGRTGSPNALNGCEQALDKIFLELF